MIPRAYINQWRNNVLWQEDEQVEQDLILSRALVQIFSDDLLQKSLAFRGGTALHKLFNLEQKRYSEDIDLVVTHQGPMGLIFDAMQRQLNPWLGTPRRDLKRNRANLYYKYNPENSASEIRRIKVEINTEESFSACGYESIIFRCDSPWFTGLADIKTFNLNELLGTKLRALYQRKKGRDLFDIYWGIKHPLYSRDLLINAFTKYMEHGGTVVSRAQFEENLLLKIEDPTFRSDISSLLVSLDKFNINDAYTYVLDEIIKALPGKPWKSR